jgi:polysaccharide pyruvyl transferase CsaB
MTALIENQHKHHRFPEYAADHRRDVQMKKLHIGISGSYGGLNLGDEAILQSIINLLRKRLKNCEITVLSRNPEDTLKRHHVEQALPVRSMSRDEIMPEIRKLDLFILGGGGILIDGEVANFLREVIIAKESNIPVIVYGISAAPLDRDSEREMVKKWLNVVDLVTVREKTAKKILEDMGVTREIVVTTDPAVLLEPEEISRTTLAGEYIKGKNYIGISVREPGPALQVNIELYHSYIAHAADYMIERFNHEVIFVPMERNVSDMQSSYAVIAQMLNPQKVSVLKGEYSPGQLLYLFANHFVFGVGMRLHFLIFLAIAGVPFAPLPYASKVESFIQDLNIQLPPSQLNPGRLIAYIDRMWHQRNQNSRKITKGIDTLRSRAVEANEMIIHFIENYTGNKTLR